MYYSFTVFPYMTELRLYNKLRYLKIEYKMTIKGNSWIEDYYDVLLRDLMNLQL